MVLQKIKITSFGCKVPLGVFLKKNGSFGELGYQGFLSPFGGRQGLLHVPGWMRLEKTICLNSVGKHTQKCDREN